MSEAFDRSTRYPTEPYGNVPVFHSTEEEAEFWDTHDFTEYGDTSKPVMFYPSHHKSMQIRWTTEADDELTRIAAEKHLKKSTLARAWLLERLEQERQCRAS